jgi:predicted TIM-barrel fold metal-dependent hydrolase
MLQNPDPDGNHAMKSIPTIDAHHHIWRLNDLQWLSGPPVPRIFGPYQPICRDYSIEEYRADLVGCDIVKSIYVQTNWPAGRSYDEAQWVQSVSDRTGWPHANVAHADLADPDVGAQIRRLAKLPATRGIRQQLHWHRNPQYSFAPVPDLMNGAAWRRGLAMLADHQLLFELQIFAGQMADGARLAKAFPRTTFVVEHAGMLEDMSPDGLRLWREGMMALADSPNVNAKLSGLGTFVHACRADLMKFIVGETVAMFGADRCLFGSNFPIEKLWTDYRTLYRNFRMAIADLTETEQAAILHDTAARLYRIA